MLKKIIVGILFSVTFIVCSSAWAFYNRTLLVLDMRNSNELPRHFRTTSDVANSKDLNLKGFADLHAVGSAQFSKLSLENVLQKKLKGKNVVIVDLREESHGFLNGNAISWYAPHNAANAGLRPVQIEHIQAKLLSELDKLSMAKVFKILKKVDSRVERIEPLEFSVHQVSSEADSMVDYNVEYQRIYVQDYHPPRDNQVDRFIRLVRTLPPHTWIYFHCRAGMGRTSTFMAMYDMMRNAKHVSYDQIIARQLAIGGKDFDRLPSPDSYKYPFAVERVNFLKQFYQYAHDNDDNFRTSWKEWEKAR